MELLDAVQADNSQSRSEPLDAFAIFVEGMKRIDWKAAIVDDDAGTDESPENSQIKKKIDIEPTRVAEKAHEFGHIIGAMKFSEIQDLNSYDLGKLAAELVSVTVNAFMELHSSSSDHNDVNVLGELAASFATKFSVADDCADYGIPVRLWANAHSSFQSFKNDWLEISGDEELYSQLSVMVVAFLLHGVHEEHRLFSSNLQRRRSYCESIEGIPATHIQFLAEFLAGFERASASQVADSGNSIDSDDVVTSHVTDVVTAGNSIDVDLDVTNKDYDNLPEQTPRHARGGADLSRGRLVLSILFYLAGEYVVPKLDNPNRIKCFVEHFDAVAGLDDSDENTYAATQCLWEDTMRHVPGHTRDHNTRAFMKFVATNLQVGPGSEMAKVVNRYLPSTC
ncbi:hypothetical protein CYMTET_56068 [Cymbomonas tetramitiformis]|uniref:Uncharacterized protein n=1 Tax=Cymbomonas tetramitiformis TaxID=36881 RepID=A0AAE0BBP5_9CHLO|nr:hypothetical protein CYMTET_56068 [Cymbomonas tetramitiformis]